MKLLSSEIAEKYGLKHKGDPIAVTGVGNISDNEVQTLKWVRSEKDLSADQRGVVVGPPSITARSKNGLTLLITNQSPRLVFSIIVNQNFSHLFPDEFTNCLGFHKQNKKIQIGENCFIGENVVIGDGTVILHNTSIFANTSLGKNCYISSNCSISTPGLGFEYDADRIVRFPQIGRVEIENHVEIGPNSTVRRGALGSTVIQEGCKIGSLSNIGHNCLVGSQSILTSQVVLGGSSRIGSRVFMGINSAIKNKVSIGNDVTVGMGAMVTKDFPDNVTIVGVPAKILI